MLRERREKQSAYHHAKKLHVRSAADPDYNKMRPCEICGKDKPLSWDHCHDTGLHRGWLCTNCNTAIGKLGDNLAGVMRAVKYLERFEK